MVEPLFVDLRHINLPVLPMFKDDLWCPPVRTICQFRVFHGYVRWFGVQDHIVHLPDFLIQMRININNLVSLGLSFA